MRDYEVVYIFKSSLTTEEIEARLEGYHARILASDGSEITAVEHWGKRQLAYPIDRNDNGYYVVTQFTASPAVLPDYERALKLDEDLMRHLVVLSEGELPMPAPDDRDERRGDGRNADRGKDGAEGQAGPDEAKAEGDEKPSEDAGDDEASEGEGDDEASENAGDDEASEGEGDDEASENAGDDDASEDDGDDDASEEKVEDEEEDR